MSANILGRTIFTIFYKHHSFIDQVVTLISSFDSTNRFDLNNSVDVELDDTLMRKVYYTLLYPVSKSPDHLHLDGNLNREKSKLH